MATHTSATDVPTHDRRDSLSRQDLSQLTGGLKALITTDHPVLKTVAEYLFDSAGKRVRPSMVLLMAHATSVENGSAEEVPHTHTYRDIPSDSCCLATTLLSPCLPS